MVLFKAIRAIAGFMVLQTTVATSYDYQSPVMNAATPSNLEVRIESASEPSTLNIVISNTHESTPLTILTWDAPFDRSARDSGIYHIQPTTPGASELKSLGLKIKRGLPASRTALLEIPARGHVTEQLQLKSRWIPTDGERYKVWAKGPWRAVWTKKADDVTDEDLKTVLGDFEYGERYETNAVEVVLG